MSGKARYGPSGRGTYKHRSKTHKSVILHEDHRHETHINVKHAKRRMTKHVTRRS